MALTLTTLTGTILQPDDVTPCHGSVVLTPGSGLLVSADDNRILAGEITVVLDDAGSFSKAIPSTDNTGLQPEPGTWNWSIRFKLTDASIAPFSFALPATPSTVDLADVARVAPAPGTYIVVPGPAGPPGPEGPPGSGGGTYLHTQTSPAATWQVAHNLGRTPNIAVINTSGTVVYADIAHNSTTLAVITFPTATTGTAMCS